MIYVTSGFAKARNLIDHDKRTGVARSAEVMVNGEWKRMSNVKIVAQQSRKRGRPAKTKDEKAKPINFRIYDHTREEFNRMCELTGFTQREMFETLVAEFPASVLEELSQ